MNNLEMRHRLIKIGQNRLRFRFHNGLRWLHSGELSDRLHRLPKREHNKFHHSVHSATKQICSAMSFDGSKDIAEHICFVALWTEWWNLLCSRFGSRWRRSESSPE